MQALSIYSVFVDDPDSYNKIVFKEKYNKYKEEHNGLILNKIESTTIVHNTYINNDTVKESFHPVHIIDKESYLYDAYKQDIIDEALGLMDSVEAIYAEGMGVNVHRRFK